MRIPLKILHLCGSLIKQVKFKPQVQNILNTSEIYQKYKCAEERLKVNKRWFKYDRDWFVGKQAARRSSCATLREWSHNLHPPSCTG